MATRVPLLSPLGDAAQDGGTTGGGEPEFISTVACAGEYIPGEGGLALAAGQESLQRAAEDGSGNLHIADPGSHHMLKVARAGGISTVACNRVRGF